MTRIGFWFQALSKRIWRLGCRIGGHCLIWSSLVCQTCKLCSSKQSSIFLLLWCLPELLPQPILWNNQLLQVKILPIFYLGAGAHYVNPPLWKLQRWPSSSPQVSVRCFHTSSTCHTSCQSLVLPFASPARNNLLWWSLILEPRVVSTKVFINFL